MTDEIAATIEAAQDAIEDAQEAIDDAIEDAEDAADEAERTAHFDAVHARLDALENTEHPSAYDDAPLLAAIAALDAKIDGMASQPAQTAATATDDVGEGVEDARTQAVEATKHNATEPNRATAHILMRDIRTLFRRGG